MSIRPNLNYPENMVWSLEPLQISSGRVTNGRILFLKSSKAGGLNFGTGGPYGPVRIRDIREFRLYGRPRLTASIPDIVRPDAYSAQHPPIPSIQLCPTPPKWTSSPTSTASTSSNHLPRPRH